VYLYISRIKCISTFYGLLIGSKVYPYVSSLTHPCCCALRHFGLLVSSVLQLFVQQRAVSLGPV
jgi:hypothetical protein